MSRIVTRCHNTKVCQLRAGRLLHIRMEFFTHERGKRNNERVSPQGSQRAHLPTNLANMALDGLELILNQRYRKLSPSGKWRSRDNGHKVNLVRYADDFIITADSKELLETEIKPMVEEFLAARGLSLSQEKTCITHISDGFDFLGSHIRRYPDGVFRIKPSQKNAKAFLDKVRGIFRAHKAITAESLIRQLNPVIQGWYNHHKYHCGRRDLQKAAAQIFDMSWRWAKRRHPNKGKKWIKRKYFPANGKRSWAFSGEAKYGDRIYLYQMDSKKTVRYQSIKKDLNPYDPQWYNYLNNRDAKREESRKLERLQKSSTRS